MTGAELKEYGGKKVPAELYGISYEIDNLKKLQKACILQTCPFLNKKCVKQRKSDSSLTIGSCSLGYQKNAIIVCPHRFLERNQIFLDVIKLLKPRAHYFIVPEIALPGGNVDYFVVAKEKEVVVDYVGIEIQGLDTTGSGGIWQARQDAMAGVMKDSYSYGMNWKMSAKTILMQMHHKAMTFESLRKKLVLVVQSEFFEYMSREFRTRHMTVANDRDSIQFHIYDFVQVGQSRSIVLRDRKSTDVAGITEMLRLSDRPEITEDEVIKLIELKMDAAKEIVLS